MAGELEFKECLWSRVDTGSENCLEWGGEPHPHPTASPSYQRVSPMCQVWSETQGSSILSTFEGPTGLTLPENVKRGWISLWAAVVCL